jgi:ADP-heptose:LPS heptosyltransferase
MLRVLIIRCGALGDLVYATSVIDAIRLEFGDDTIIDFVCTPGSGTLFNNDPRINTVFPLKHKKIPIFFSKEKREIIHTSQDHPYDILINFEYGKQFTSLLNTVVAKKKIGAVFDKINYDKKINRGEMIKHYLTNIISKDNLNKSFPNIATTDFAPLKEKFHLEDKFYILSPSNSHIFRSGINYRAWPNAHWVELIEKLSNEGQVVIVGAKGEEKFFQDLKPFPKNVVDLVGKNNINELASIIKHAKATICTDSAVGHIAAAVDSPVYVLMGPNDTITDSPYKTPKNHVTPISLHLECSPCYKTQAMKNCTGNTCMTDISATMVYNTIVQ